MMRAYPTRARRRHPGIAASVALTVLALGAIGASSSRADPEEPGSRGQDADGLLPSHRIVTFYGNPRAPRMGILGHTPVDSMLAALDRQARAYAIADPDTPVRAGLHLVTVVAQPHPGADGQYRARAPLALVEEVQRWAEPDSLLVFLDIQPGRSPLLGEVAAYETALLDPRTHLAVDPEFAVGPDEVPGRVIGRVDAAAINEVIEYLSELVEANDLPPKILVIHRFTQRMLRNADAIRLDPRVQVVIDMDGFGPPPLKRDSYRQFVAAEPVQYTGFKLFYLQDRPLMTPEQVLELEPVPHFIIYQ